jgi:small-conductance mechanosensitive channel
MDTQLQTLLSFGQEVQSKLLTSAIIILLLWLTQVVVIWLINRRIEPVQLRYRWRKTVTYVAMTLGILLVGWLWLPGLQSMITFLGLLSAGLAIALQRPITDLAGWIFIIWRRPFQVGDRIQIGPHAGDVIDTRIFQFTLLEIGNWVAADQSTGRILHIPNGKVFSEVLANYSKGFEYIWHEIPVLITFESDWEKAKALLQDIANRHAAHLSEDAQERVRQAARRFMIMYSKLTPVVYTRVEASGVLLTLRYLCDPRNRRASEQAIWEDILYAFAAEPKIEFAYPTQRFYNHQSESVPIDKNSVSANN